MFITVHRKNIFNLTALHEYHSFWLWRESLIEKANNQSRVTAPCPPSAATKQTECRAFCPSVVESVDPPRRFIPSSYRPSFASVVQVAWQAYMSRVSYDNPHHHASPSHQPPITATIEAGGSGGVLVRGGGEGARVETAGGGAAKGTGGGGGRRRVGEGIAPPPGFPVVGGSAVDGGPVRRTAMADRRATGRYAYASTSSGTVAARGGDGSVSRAVKDGMNVSGGGGGGGDGVRVLGAARTPPIPSSPLFSKAKEL